MPPSPLQIGDSMQVLVGKLKARSDKHLRKTDPGKVSLRKAWRLLVSEAEEELAQLQTFLKQDDGDSQVMYGQMNLLLKGAEA